MNLTIDPDGSTENEEPLLSGAVVQRVYLPAPPALGEGVFAVVLRLRRPGETAFVLAAAGKRGARIGVVSLESWRRAALSVAEGASSAKQHWRTQLEGGRIVGITDDWIAVERDGRRIVIAPPAAGAVLTRPGAGDEEATAARETEREAYRARGEALLETLASGSIDASRAQLRRALDRTIARLSRRADAIRGDRARVAEAGDLAAQATAFVAAASRAARGATSLTITDWTSGEAREQTLPLDPARPARAQIDAMFKRARRLKQGGAIVEKRLAETEAILAALIALRPRAEAATALDEIETLRAEARASAPRDFALAGAAGTSGHGGTGRSAGREERPPYRAFTGASGARILVGRGAAHNDALTLHVARPHDLWLHAKGRAGAHVIVPLTKKHTCPGDVLVEAAHLAAHFSDARDEAIVDVQYTPRRFLRKPRGAAPGLVVVDREKVIALRKDDELLAALLAREELGA